MWARLLIFREFREWRVAHMHLRCSCVFTPPQGLLSTDFHKSPWLAMFPFISWNLLIKYVSFFKNYKIGPIRNTYPLVWSPLWEKFLFHNWKHWMTQWFFKSVIYFEHLTQSLDLENRNRSLCLRHQGWQPPKWRPSWPPSGSPQWTQSYFQKV